MKSFLSRCLLHITYYHHLAFSIEDPGVIRIISPFVSGLTSDITSTPTRLGILCPVTHLIYETSINNTGDNVM